MPSLHLQRSDVVVGIDTHKDEHLAVALDGIGGRLGSLTLPASPDGYRSVLSWARERGRVVAFGALGARAATAAGSPATSVARAPASTRCRAHRAGGRAGPPASRI